MDAKKFILIYGVIVLIYGILFLFLTGTAYDLYGNIDQSSDLTTALIKNLGIMFVSAGVMGIIGSKASASHGRKAILAFIGLSSIIFLIFSVMNLTSGNGGGTMPVVDTIVQAFFGIGGLYFFSKENGFGE